MYTLFRGCFDSCLGCSVTREVIDYPLTVPIAEPTTEIVVNVPTAATVVVAEPTEPKEIRGLSTVKGWSTEETPEISKRPTIHQLVEIMGN
jgi:hypothetical protein